LYILYVFVYIVHNYVPPAVDIPDENKPAYQDSDFTSSLLQ
jgi:hypothetical protein